MRKLKRVVIKSVITYRHYLHQDLIISGTSDKAVFPPVFTAIIFCEIPLNCGEFACLVGLIIKMELSFHLTPLISLTLCSHQLLSVWKGSYFALNNQSRTSLWHRCQSARRRSVVVVVISSSFNVRHDNQRHMSVQELLFKSTHNCITLIHTCCCFCWECLPHAAQDADALAVKPARGLRVWVAEKMWCEQQWRGPEPHCLYSFQHIPKHDALEV